MFMIHTPQNANPVYRHYSAYSALAGLREALQRVATICETFPQEIEAIKIYTMAPNDKQHDQEFLAHLEHWMAMTRLYQQTVLENIVAKDISDEEAGIRAWTEAINSVEERSGW